MMYPKWRIIFGAMFTTVIWLVAPKISSVYLALIFFSSFLIDLDHYLVSFIKTKKLSVKDSFQYYARRRIEEKREVARDVRRKEDFHLFHTVEFHVFIGLLGIFWVGFFYVFIGMVFHSLLDIFTLIRGGVFYRREFFFFNWVRK